MRLSSTPQFRVLIAPHDIPPRFRIEEQERLVYAADSRLARKYAIRSAHRDAEIPPLRSLLRVSWPYATATALGFSLRGKDGWDI